MRDSRFIRSLFLLLTIIVPLWLSACGSSGGEDISVISNPVTPNTQPVVNAGINVNALKNVYVILDGSASSDADGDLLTYYSWTFYMEAQQGAPADAKKAARLSFNVRPFR